MILYDIVNLTPTLINKKESIASTAVSTQRDQQQKVLLSTIVIYHTQMKMSIPNLHFLQNLP